MPMAVAVVAAKRLLLVGSSLTLGDTLASGGSSTPPCELVQHAVVSTFDLFSIGIGPSSSHTVGPMRAAKIFVEDLEQGRVLERVSQMRVDLYGSLALTGKGHGTPEAILMGLEGEAPESINTKGIAQRVALIETDRVLNLRQSRRIVQ